MLDESLLDAPEALARADRRDLLRGAAEAGARVRTATRHAAEAGIGDLAPEGRPRAVLVAGPGTAASGVADLIGALAGASAPVTAIRPTGVAAAAGALRWTLPGWAGSVDLLLIATADGTEPGLALLAEQAYRRGCTIVAVAPVRSPLREAVDGAHGLVVPMAAAPHGEYDAETSASKPGHPLGPAHPAARPAGPGRPHRRAHGNAAEGRRPPRPHSGALRTGHRHVRQPGQDPCRGARRQPAPHLDGGRGSWPRRPPLRRRPRRARGPPRTRGRAAGSAALPRGTARRSVRGGGDPDDFFRDRVDEPEAMRARVVLLRDRPTGGLTAGPAARELALSHDTAISELEPEEGSELEALAELLAVTDFAAVYASLASDNRA